MNGNVRVQQHRQNGKCHPNINANHHSDPNHKGKSVSVDDVAMREPIISAASAAMQNVEEESKEDVMSVATTMNSVDTLNIDVDECQYPIKVIAFDLDKTLVRTISLHHDQQPQPEQYENGYFMFFDDDTKEFHHVYKRPYLKELLEFLYAKVATRVPKVKMMLCTHGTQKYAQTILERCGADKLFPIMLPRRDWSRRKFEDDYKPRRFKTINKMAQKVNARVEDVLMIDDDPGVYCKADRIGGSLLHILPFDDPFLQRQDRELDKLIQFLTAILKYGKSWYIKTLVTSSLYTRITGNEMAVYNQHREFYFRSQMAVQLMSINIPINTEEQLGTMLLFDRFLMQYPVDWQQLQDERRVFAFYALHFFVCLFMIRGYLYRDSLRPKQFRRDPYSSTIWTTHIPMYEYLARKYGTLDGIRDWKPERRSGGKHRSHRSSNSHSHSHRGSNSGRHNPEQQGHQGQQQKEDSTQHQRQQHGIQTVEQQQQHNTGSPQRQEVDTQVQGAHTQSPQAQPSDNSQEQKPLQQQQQAQGASPSVIAVPNRVLVTQNDNERLHLEMMAQLQANEANLTPQQRQWLNDQRHILSMNARQQPRHKKRKHRNHEKKFLFQSLHQLYLNVFDAVGYPKLLHGLYYRPKSGYDNEMFVQYEAFARFIFEHAEQGAMQQAQQQQQQRQAQSSNANANAHAHSNGNAPNPANAPPQ